MIFKEPRRQTLAGKGVLSFEKRELTRANLILDTNLAEVPIMLNYININGPGSPYREVFQKLRKISDKYKTSFYFGYRTDQLVAEKLWRENKISRDDLDIAKMHYGLIHRISFTYWTQIEELQYDFQEWRYGEVIDDTQFIYPETGLAETFSSEYKMIDGKLQWIGPKDIIKRAVEIPRIRKNLKNIHQLDMTVSRESPEYQSVLRKLEQVDIGGKKGINDRQIIADIFFARTEPGATPLFATADKGILRGLLRLKYPYPYVEKLIEAFRKQKIQELREIVTNAHDFKIDPQPAAERLLLELWPIGRVIHISDIEIVDSTNTTRKMDLLYFLNTGKDEWNLYR